jgi:hypothetical protein
MASYDSGEGILIGGELALTELEEEGVNLRLFIEALEDRTISREDCSPTSRSVGRIKRIWHLRY